MDLRRRIAALALFGVQLLQGVLPAAGAACERPALVAETTVGVAAPADVHQHHAAAVYDVGPPAPIANEHAAHPASETVPVQHSHAPAACPMAMACTVVGVTSAAVAVTTVDVAVDVHRPLHVADWPVSLDVAPEPPPPRA